MRALDLDSSGARMENVLKEANGGLLEASELISGWFITESECGRRSSTFRNCLFPVEYQKEHLFGGGLQQ